MPKAAGKDKEMDGVEKAAILLIALGPEKSAQIFKHLKEDEIEQLTLEIANTSSVSPQTKEMVLMSFTKYVWHSSTLPKAVFLTQRNCSKRRLAKTRQRMLSAS